MKKIHISLIACLVLTLISVNYSFAQRMIIDGYREKPSIFIDGIPVRGKPIDGNLANDMTETKSPPILITTSSPLIHRVNLNQNYAYKFDVFSVDFSTSFGIHGYDYQNQNSKPYTSSQFQPFVMHEDRRWSESTLAYRPGFDGDHFLKIKAHNTDPYGSAVRINQGYVFVNIYRWSVQEKQSQDTVFACRQGECMETSHTFGQSSCRKSDPYCNGGPCRSPGCP